MHLMSDNSYYKLNVGGIAEIISGCFVVLIGDIFEMDYRRQKRASEIRLRGGAVRLSRRRVRVKRSKGVPHHGELLSMRISLSSGSSRNNEMHATVLSSVLLSGQDDISPATVTIT